MGWSYYDLDKHWGKFFETWSSDEVQTVLYNDVKDLCQASLPLWRKNDPLWQLVEDGWFWSRWGYRMQMLEEATYGKDIRKHSKSAICRAANIKASEGFVDVLVARLREDLYKESRPKPGTLDSLLLIPRRELLHTALLETACHLVPDSRIFSLDIESGSYVVLPDEHLVLDLLGFYWFKGEKDADWDPQIFEELFRCVNFEMPFQYRI